MKTGSIGSYAELESSISGMERSFLLLYKGGADQSECALRRIAGAVVPGIQSVFTADVNLVRDIHGRLGVDTAPSLVVFRLNRVVNIIRGCQTEAAYESILAGREMGADQGDGGKRPKQVTVYTTPTCSWCTTLKAYLDSHHVPYREVNVASDTAAAEAMVRKSGQQGVPQTEINGQMIVGFDRARINQLLEIQ
jgi:glutaredoxin-like YruB-family protein